MSIRLLSTLSRSFAILPRSHCVQPLRLSYGNRLFQGSALVMTDSPFNPWAEDLPKPIEELGTYLAIIPDLKDSKRLDIRPLHLAGAQVAHEKGWLVKAGALLADDPYTDKSQPPKMTGSWMLVRDVSIEAARARLAKDIYTTGGAWDMDNATITAVAVAKH